MQDQEISQHELEQFEKSLSKFQSQLSPSVEFQERMKKRLERHYTLMQQGTNEMGETQAIGFWGRFGTRVYTAATAFVFVLFTGGLSTFAYTTDSVTNGNPLYPIKRGIETIENSLTNSTEGQAEFQLKMIERRLAESRFLMLRGVIDENTTQEVSAAVNEGIVAIQEIPEVDARDVLLGRVATLLKAEEKKYYEIAGVDYPEDTTTTSDIETSSPALVPDQASDRGEQQSSEALSRLEREKNAEQAKRIRNKDDKRGQEDRVDDRDNSATTRPQKLTVPSPAPQSATSTTQLGNPTLRDNVTVPLNVENKVIEAIQQNSEHLKLMELRLRQVRRTR